jgi:hypothetical protein
MIKAKLTNPCTTFGACSLLIPAVCHKVGKGCGLLFVEIKQSSIINQTEISFFSRNQPLINERWLAVGLVDLKILILIFQPHFD